MYAKPETENELNVTVRSLQRAATESYCITEVASGGIIIFPLFGVTIRFAAIEFVS